MNSDPLTLESSPRTSRRHSLRTIRMLALCGLVATCAPAQQADDLPHFIVPGQETEMARMDELFRLHVGGAFSDCTLWDAWLPHSTLWVSQHKRDRYRASFLGRRIDSEGYVSMQQHRGMAHSDGWPFPAWQQSTGKGWHFSVANEPWAVQNFKTKALTSADGWEITGAEIEALDAASGMKLKATADTITATTPEFSCGTIVAPFARIEWAAHGLSPESRPAISWMLRGAAAWKSAPFPPLSDADGMRYANVPLYRQPGYDGLLTRYRLTFDHAAGAQITLKSIITAIDTRHPITNANFIRGSAEYFAWTTDLPFLRENIARMRRALRWALAEFGVRERKLVHVPWVGHDGRSGLELTADGKKKFHPGLGVGNNYWDLLPFGGDDALATIYHYDALVKFAALERDIAAHPEWTIPRDGDPFSPDDLTSLAAAIKTTAGKTFWNDTTGRFAGWRDATGRAYDYGFTFVNLEAVYYGLANEEQARSIFAWLDGKRNVDGDTSQGADIFHWRFGPRSTTRRNIECYVWPWSGPESIPWGGQVQDGGAVLGFTYFELMSRLRTLGADDALRRLHEVLAWFGDVQAEGGYRKYYAKPGRGTLQGGGTAGGLGFDAEFMESALLPTVMLYGFLGVEPQPGGLRITPRLPAAWPSLTITNVRAQGHVLDITAARDELRFTARAADGSDFALWLPAGKWEVAPLTGAQPSTKHEADGAHPLVLRFTKDGGFVCRRTEAK